MSRAPLYGPSLNTLQPGRLRDLVPAQVALLQSVDVNQHTLMTAWGGPPVCHTFYLNATGSTAKTITIRMPPGVTDCDLSLLLAGTGTVTITTGADATGVALTASAGNTEEFAEWVSTGGPAPTSDGVSSGRAVIVATSSSWAWADVDFTLTISSVTTTFSILALETRPVHQPR